MGDKNPLLTNKPTDFILYNVIRSCLPLLAPASDNLPVEYSD
jgi:hypothetical protein